MSRLTVNRGTTYTITVNYQKNGVAADMTGGKLRFTVKTAQYDTDDTDAAAKVKKDITSFITPSGTTNASQALITLLPADTQDIPPANYFYDVKFQDISGVVTQLDFGTFVLSATPTNRLV